MDVICDTNIWYAIGDKRVPDEELSSVNLYGTYISIREFVKTPLLTKDLPKVQRAATAFKKCSTGTFELNPIDFIIKKQFPNYECIDNTWQKALKDIDHLISINASEKINQGVRDQMNAAIEDAKTIAQEAANMVNDFLPQVRLKIKESKNKKKHRGKTSYPIFFDLINLFVQKFTNERVSLQMETYPWQDIELFIRTWDNYFKDLEVSPDQKFQANDWFDLFNMVYVDKSKKYSTEEKKWITLIENDKATLPYLHKFPSLS